MTKERPISVKKRGNDVSVSFTISDDIEEEIELTHKALIEREGKKLDNGAAFESYPTAFFDQMAKAYEYLYDLYAKDKENDHK